MLKARGVFNQLKQTAKTFDISATNSELGAKPGSFGGFEPPNPPRWHAQGAKALGAGMWFWVFYRASEDGDVLLGYRWPWEHKH